jgi:hypothetical protein
MATRAVGRIDRPREAYLAAAEQRSHLKEDLEISSFLHL